jgi:hypothetical protein
MCAKKERGRRRPAAGFYAGQPTGFASVRYSPARHQHDRGGSQLDLFDSVHEADPNLPQDMGGGCCTHATPLLHQHAPVPSSHICTGIPSRAVHQGTRERIASATCPDVALANEEAGQ